MLAAQCPIKTIGDVLGHVVTDTTMEYANVDLAALRQVALSEAESRRMTPPGRASSSDFSSPVATALQHFLDFKRAAGCRYRGGSAGARRARSLPRPAPRPE